MYSMWNTVTQQFTHCTYVFIILWLIWHSFTLPFLMTHNEFDTHVMTMTHQSVLLLTHLQFDIRVMLCLFWDKCLTQIKNVSFLIHLYFPYTPKVCHFWHTFNLTSVSCHVIFWDKCLTQKCVIFDILVFPVHTNWCVTFDTPSIWHLCHLVSFFWDKCLTQKCVHKMLYWELKSRKASIASTI